MGMVAAGNVAFSISQFSVVYVCIGYIGGMFVVLVLVFVVL